MWEHPILKKQLTQVTTFSLGASWSVDTKNLRTWNCPTFEELGCTLKSLVSRLGEDVRLNSRCNCCPLLLPVTNTHAGTDENSSHLPVLRRVSIAEGAGDDQDQSFVFQVHDVIFFHGHHLGERMVGRGRKKMVREKWDRTRMMGEGVEEREREKKR